MAAKRRAPASGEPTAQARAQADASAFAEWAARKPIEAGARRRRKSSWEASKGVAEIERDNAQGVAKRRREPIFNHPATVYVVAAVVLACLAAAWLDHRR